MIVWMLMMIMRRTLILLSCNDSCNDGDSSCICVCAVLIFIQILGCMRLFDGQQDFFDTCTDYVEFILMYQNT